MLLVVLLAAVLALAAVAWAATFAVLRTLELRRQFRSFMAALEPGLKRVSDGSELLSARAASVSTSDVEAAVGRLAVSQARLSVLLAAFADVRAETARVTDLRPRK